MNVVMFVAEVFFGTLVLSLIVYTLNFTYFDLVILIYLDTHLFHFVSLISKFS